MTDDNIKGIVANAHDNYDALRFVLTDLYQRMDSFTPDCRSRCCEFIAVLVLSESDAIQLIGPENYKQAVKEIEAAAEYGWGIPTRQKGGE
jgi:hypothetical protein